MDLLQGIKDMEQDSLKDVPPPDMENMPMPTVEDLLKALDGFSGMSEEEKDHLRDQLTGKTPGGFMAPEQTGGAQQFLILLSLLFVVACIFVFFGYKLYKSLADKERKRDEKRKMKQLKKKK